MCVYYHNFSTLVILNLQKGVTHAGIDVRLSDARALDVVRGGEECETEASRTSKKSRIEAMSELCRKSEIELDPNRDT